jgi:hypothetical protein
MITVFGRNYLEIYDWMLSESVLGHGSYRNISLGSLLAESQYSV